MWVNGCEEGDEHGGSCPFMPVWDGCVGGRGGRDSVWGEPSLESSHPSQLRAPKRVNRLNGAMVNMRVGSINGDGETY